MGILGIIPARYASTRFPGKPLADIQGRSMILRVFDRARLSKVFDDVIVATDDDRIASHVAAAGYNAVMTSPEHRSGTDRCLEALDTWEAKQGTIFDHVINIQGDEPFIHPDQIKDVAGLLTSAGAPIATLAKLITKNEEIFSPNVVKVVFSQAMDALFFSRSPVPFLRETGEGQWVIQKAHYKHIGIYGFSTETLRQVCRIPQSNLEKHEALEQLRWLENGYRIKIAVTTHESQSVDTPEDLLKITNIA